ncbi:MAG: carboxypeptidase regulatory-like domain-containing protein, partial [Candidatus Cloacimonadaceae bacterium]|nr:carboxypeptidase regulatory-like domain-containing protein [Candidatus Cloacimonadaceae bacterium]
VFLGSTNGDHYYVKISTDGGTDWTVLWDASAQTGGWNNYATPITIDLSTYEGQQIKLAWHAVDPPSNDGLWYVWFIDNVYIGNEVSSIVFHSDEMIMRSAAATRNANQNTGFTMANLSASKAPEHNRIAPETRINTMQNKESKASSRALIGYKVWRFVAGQETNESSWTSLTPQATTNTQINDETWATLPNGTYRWAVKAVYTSDVLSVPSFSNSLVKQVVNGTVAGVVRTITNAPIAGVSITAGSYTATTNAVGAYNILLPIGTYDVTASKVGFQTQVINDVVVNANQTTTVNFVLGVVSNEDNVIPVVATELSGNYPNPFNPSTTISYAIKDPANVRLEIYNLKGQLIRTLVNEEQNTGHYRIIWNGTDSLNRPVSSGVYFYRMNAGSYSSTRKMLLME